MADENGKDYEGQERRVDNARVMAHEDRFKRIKDDIATLFKGHDASAVFLGQAKVIGIVALGIFAFVMSGSFIYTQIHIVASSKMMGMIHSESINEHDKLHRIVNKNEDDINDLTAKMMLANDRYSRLITDVGKVDTKLSQLVDMLQTHDKSNPSPYAPQYYQGNDTDHRNNGYE